MHIDLTLIVQVVAFVLLVWFVNRKLWGPVTATLAERQKRIADGLAAAERGERQLEVASKHAAELLQDAKRGSDEILTEAKRQADRIMEEAKVTARSEAKRIIDGAKVRLEQDMIKARERLRKEVAELAATMAQQILHHEIDEQTNGAVISRLIATLN